MPADFKHTLVWLDTVNPWEKKRLWSNTTNQYFNKQAQQCTMSNYNVCACLCLDRIVKMFLCVDIFYD